MGSRIYFYSLYVFSVFIFCIKPALENNSLNQALLLGAFFGLFVTPHMI